MWLPKKMRSRSGKYPYDFFGIGIQLLGLHYYIRQNDTHLTVCEGNVFINNSETEKISS